MINKHSKLVLGQDTYGNIHIAKVFIKNENST